MAYDEALAERVRKALAGGHGFSERRMFGGLAFMVRGHMVCGVLKDELMVRVGPAGYEPALAQPHTRPMDFTGRPMTGMVYVSSEGWRDEEALRRWVAAGLTYALSLPDKKSARARLGRRQSGRR